MQYRQWLKGFVGSWSPPFVVKIVRAAAGFPFNTEDVQILRIEIMRL